MGFEITPNSNKYKKEHSKEEKPSRPTVKGASKVDKKSSPLSDLWRHIRMDLKKTRDRVYDEVIVPGFIGMLDDAIDNAKNIFLYESQGLLSRKSSGKKAYDKAYQKNKATFTQEPTEAPRAKKKNVDMFCIPDKEEAEDVLDSLKNDIADYDCATLYDYYSSLGVSDSDNDAENKNWGWTDLSGAYITRGPAGYMIVMPNTVRLGM